MNTEPKRPIGWCRAERLRIGADQRVLETPDYTLVRCLEGLHEGQWILWSGEGKCLAIGSEAWVRKKLAEVPVGRP